VEQGPPVEDAAPPSSAQPAEAPPPWATQAAPPLALWGAPPPGPGWAAPAQSASGWVLPDSTGRKGVVTRLGRLAGLIVALIGALWVCFGGLLILGALVVQGLEIQMEEQGYSGVDFKSLLIVVGIVIICLALVEFIGGVGALLQQEWGRIIGIIYALMFGVGSALALLEYLTGRPSEPLAILFGIHLVAYVIVVVILLGRWRGRTPTVGS
jgi:hypothetical protein